MVFSFSEFSCNRIRKNLEITHCIAVDCESKRPKRLKLGGLNEFLSPGGPEIRGVINIIWIIAYLWQCYNLHATHTDEIVLVSSFLYRIREWPWPILSLLKLFCTNIIEILFRDFLKKKLVSYRFFELLKTLSFLWMYLGYHMI